VEADLKRLAFVRRHSVLPNTTELYLQALQRLEEKNIKDPVSAIVTYHIAQVWVEKGSQYKPLQSDDHKFDARKAFEICETAKKRFPNSDGAKMCEGLQISIQTKLLSAQIEKVNVPGQPFRALVSYKNFTALHWRIIRTSREEVKEQRRKWNRNYNVDREAKFLEYFAAKPAAKTGKVTLPDDKDFQQHSVEIKLDGVPEGDYMVLFSHTPDFKTAKNGLAYAFTTISNLSYVHRNLDNGSTEFYAVHRQTGEPLPNVQAQVLFNRYNSKSQEYELVKGGIFKSDAKGRFTVPYQNNENRRDFSVDFSLGNDHLSTVEIDNRSYYYSGQLYQYKHEKPGFHTKTFFFLDRAIYRPGQTLYFKGLVVGITDEKPKILPKQSVSVTFYDVNDQVVAQQTLTTNEYGTFSGTFTTPTSGLMGEMRLTSSADGQANFSVEEYKRPKFEVKFDTVKGSYRLGETVKAEGKAQAYSGANIDGAAVKYRVVRTARFPWWWWYWYGYYPSSPQMEITNGTAKTDAEGKFTIDFQAIPDLSVPAASNPIFNYRVMADVTDINGETHSSEMTVSVGYKALVINIDVKDISLPLPPPKEGVQNSPSLGGGRGEAVIRTTNLAGQFEPAQGTVKIWKLKVPNRAFRDRLWERPDKHVMTQDEFYRTFPHDLYADENNEFKWEKEKEVLNRSLPPAPSQGGGVVISSPLGGGWEGAGRYLIEVTATDKFGQEVKEVAYFTVFDSRAKTLTLPKIVSFSTTKLSYEPGEKAQLRVGTSADAIKVLYEIEQDGKLLSQEWLTLKNEQRLLEFPIKEEHRGNLAVHYTFVKNNRLYVQNEVITVPFTNKQLDVQFETFRDKLQPGQQEQWRIKIAGPKGDKAMAEMVAAMYDASLDVFRANGWYASFWQSMYARLNWSNSFDFRQQSFTAYTNDWNKTGPSYETPQYDRLNWFGFYGGRYYGEMTRKSARMREEGEVAMDMAAAPMAAAPAGEAEEKARGVSKPKMEQAATDDGAKGFAKGDLNDESQQEKAVDMSNVKVRTNFNETAFFFPHLQTNEKGEVILNFTMPEALTRWKFLGFAHTQDLKSGSMVKETVTQKDLMVVPNQPRFFRENDKMQFSVKITSLTDQELNGQAQLEFFDALTMRSLPLAPSQGGGKNSSPLGGGREGASGVGVGLPFSLKPRQSTNLEWSIEIPEGIQAIMYRVVAKAGNFSDGEEMVLPVVTNRMLVTETMPLPIRAGQTKTFEFTKLKNSTSKTLKTHRYTLEFTSNPAWYAVQALPYLMEYPYECVEQAFSRFYANSIASHIANANPKIKRVFDTWKNLQPDALLSNLEKNQELKTALLEETPWVLNAKDESQRKRNVALLFDLNRMANEQERAIEKVLKAQTSSGGFQWFPGFPEDRYMTQHIVAGLGHLDVMQVKTVRQDDRIWNMTTKALGYLDNQIRDDYERLKAEAKKGNIKLEDNHLGYLEIHYLYTRSYFRDVAVPNRSKEAFDYYLGQAKKYWLQNSMYMQGMMGLALHRYGDKTTVAAIIKSLNERALRSEEMGMYWKYETGWYWYQAPIETQALLIELYEEAANDAQAVDDLKTWLLKQKQTQDWRTTKATSEACYALLRRGADWLANDKLVEVQVGKEKLDPANREDTKVEAGTGYFKTAWTADQVTPAMGEITVKNPNNVVAWGAAYWQYFEQLDKITPAATPLSLKKQLFLQQNTPTGPKITPITDKTDLKVGDLVKVRIELRVDRTMEYVHLKDMRAVGFEPTQTLSTYKYQDGLWYYESPRDLATNFFMSRLNKGTYVFEYPLRVSQKGDFSNGITTIQCMYAPEFSSHSEGVRVKVK
jgi:uncharacterized protein YfaS (alpha-2-macroglobulin family)